MALHASNNIGGAMQKTLRLRFSLLPEPFEYCSLFTDLGLHVLIRLDHCFNLLAVIVTQLVTQRWSRP